MNMANKAGCAKPIGRSVFFTAVLSFLCLTAPAFAGMVTGEVREAGRQLKEATIEVRGSRNNIFRVKTDKNGRYNVNLPPGIYKATNPKDKRKGELILQSSPQPNRQDLDFGRR